LKEKYDVSKYEREASKQQRWGISS
jgi:hypothetical protein